MEKDKEVIKGWITEHIEGVQGCKVVSVWRFLSWQVG